MRSLGGFILLGLTLSLSGWLLLLKTETPPIQNHDPSLNPFELIQD